MEEVVERNHIRTFKGLDFYFLKTKPDQINIEDVAHALSHICRFGGHVKRFYSVAQHSIAASYMVSKENAMSALLHDATEAYINDFPTPLKRHFKEYQKVEKELYTSIAEKFNIPTEMPAEVHLVDKKLFQIEWEFFMMDSPREELKSFYKKHFELKNFNEVKLQFLNRYNQLKN